MSEAGLLRQGREELLHHHGGVLAWEGRGAAAEGAVAQREVLGRAAAAVCRGRPRGVAAQTVGAGGEAATGPRYAGGGVTDGTADTLHGEHGV